jgi:hypothetical protein
LHVRSAPETILHRAFLWASTFAGARSDGPVRAQFKGTECFGDGAAPLTEHTLVHPASTVWDMGFSWSSAVCQEVALAACCCGGLDVKQLLCEDRDAPVSFDTTFGVATDDICIFSTRGSAHSAGVAAGVDRGLERVGVERNTSKDVNGEPNATVIGIDVVDGTRLAPSSCKLAVWLTALVGLCNNPQLSPKEASMFLGLPHWFGQLSRGTYSAFNAVYPFTRLTPDHAELHLPPGALAELLLFGLLTPSLEVDLRRPWNPVLVASDATPSWGFGVAFATLTPAEVASAGRRLDRGAWFFRTPEGDPSVGSEKPRRGRCLRLPCAQRDFHVALSKRCKIQAHAGSLEATAALLAAKWACRSTKNFGTRMVFLIDAQAVCGALSKGRSSAPTIQRQVRRLAAYLLAGEILPRYGYIPTEHNPADHPSRGRKIPRVAAGRAGPLGVLRTHLKRS